jgi:ubiquinone/menaquinone biosynthesis C-methylase UbiE
MSQMNRHPFPISSFSLLSAAESGNWWFRSRNQLLLWIFETKVKPFSNMLEVGCGTGFVLHALREMYPAAALYGSEYFQEGLVFAQIRVPSAEFRQLDATKINVKEQYDVIGAFDVIEHIEQDELVLHNLARAIKPMGTLVLTVPQHEWLWSKIDEQACHVRRYSRDDLLKKIRNTGLDAVYVTSFVSLLMPLMWLSRLRFRKADFDLMSEFQIPNWLNQSFELVMRLELVLLSLGLRFPVGGSLLVVAKKM